MSSACLNQSIHQSLSRRNNGHSIYSSVLSKIRECITRQVTCVAVYSSTNEQIRTYLLTSVWVKSTAHGTKRWCPDEPRDASASTESKAAGDHAVDSSTRSGEESAVEPVEQMHRVLAAIQRNRKQQKSSRHGRAPLTPGEAHPVVARRPSLPASRRSPAGDVALVSARRRFLWAELAPAWHRSSPRGMSPWWFKRRRSPLRRRPCSPLPIAPASVLAAQCWRSCFPLPMEPLPVAIHRERRTEIGIWERWRG
jgi:hypothetical protein